LRVSSLLPGKCRDRTLNVAVTSFFHIFSNELFSHPITRRYIVCVGDSFDKVRLQICSVMLEMKHADGQPHFPPLSIRFMHSVEGANSTSTTTTTTIVTVIIIYRKARGSVISWGTTNRKVAGSIPDVTGFFSWPNPSSRTMALGSSQPLTEMSTRNHLAGKRRPARKADLTAICETTA
jgi:hypothetical protein